MKRILIDLTGYEFGRLIVLRRGPNDARNHTRWICKCECGSEILTRGEALRSGVTRSCGCLQKEMTAEKFTIHGQWGIPEYKIWDAMVQRCTNPKSKHYHDYGGRGITVCKQWMDFRNFLADMGERPSPELTIERINNNKGYSPDNCKWATQTEQSRNTRLFVTNTSGFKGVSWMEKHQKYQTYIYVNNKRISLGYHADINKAIAARKAAEIVYWGKAVGY